LTIEAIEEGGVLEENGKTQCSFEFFEKKQENSSEVKVSVKLAMKKAQKAWSKSEKVSHKKGLSNHLDLKD